ncbi:polyhydroxybutyrate depolymerase [Actinoplanes sp. KI2]|uniref:extracellular catalytic domain type 1 short-chain-length polyhydroxyalkanoate depolymerase n=1 Tax=Actinoplanes sp. KI2 TaxID=2983315 RepID=UPI0021D5ABB5|nr:PHB depolymerase family esterase [Actinoplanes sp. KI2]MCU7723984.1 polyhydroxybutyrate depolymerase [Actinoplanes sp. KI2]
MRARVLVLVTLLLLGCAGCRPGRGTMPTTTGGPATPAGSSGLPVPGGPAVSVPEGQSTGALTVGDHQRTYRLYRPAGVTRAAPLVVVLHGAAGSGRQAEAAYGWDAEADTGKFLVAYPDGVGHTWNVDPDCCGAAARDDVDDVGFITRLAGSFGSLVDRSRIFATGISNGAMMAYRLACDTKIFAAIGPDSGTMINDCAHPAPLSIIHIHGTADGIIPYDGGPGRLDNAGAGARLPAKIDGPPIPSLIATWRRTDNCGTPHSTTAGLVTTSTATCPGGRAVELITIAGAGHQWPGGRTAPALQRLLHLDPPSTALTATPTIWTFFAAHPGTRAG